MLHNNLAATFSVKNTVPQRLGNELFKDEAQTAIFKDPVLTALETRFISVIKTNQVYMSRSRFFSEVNTKTNKHSVGRMYNS
jgi:hypothetical protein